MIVVPQTIKWNLSLVSNFRKKLTNDIPPRNESKVPQKVKNKKSEISRVMIWKDSLPTNHAKRGSTTTKNTNTNEKIITISAQLIDFGILRSPHSMFFINTNPSL